MAYVPYKNGAGWWLTVTVIDRNEDNATLTYELRASDYDEAFSYSNTIMTRLTNVSQCRVIGFNVQHRFYNDTPSIPEAGELQTKARISFKLEASRDYQTFDIIDPEETIFMTTVGKGNKIVNITNVNVIAYANIFKSDVGFAFISDGESLETISEGKKVSSRSGLRA